jgi:hypothetical protein
VISGRQPDRSILPKSGQLESSLPGGTTKAGAGGQPWQEPTGPTARFEPWQCPVMRRILSKPLHETFAHQLMIQVSTVWQGQIGQHSPVAVVPSLLDPDHLPERKLRRPCLGTAAIVLSDFRGVDPSEPDLNLVAPGRQAIELMERTHTVAGISTSSSALPTSGRSRE